MKCPIIRQNCTNACPWNTRGKCAINIISASLATLAEESVKAANACEQQAMSVAEVAEAMTSGPAAAESEPQQNPVTVIARVANENDVNRWLDTLPLTSVIDQPTAAVYELFERWCGGQNITPVGRRTITARVKNKFAVIVGCHEGKKEESVFFPTAETFAKKGR